MELDGWRKHKLRKEGKLYSMKWATFQEASSLRISIINYFASWVSELLQTKQNEKKCRGQESARKQRPAACCGLGKTTGYRGSSVSMLHCLEHFQCLYTEWVAWAQVGLTAVSLGGLGKPLPGGARKDSVPGWLPSAPALSFLIVFCLGLFMKMLLNHLP